MINHVRIENVASTSVTVNVTRPNNTDAYAALDVIGTAVTSTLDFANVIDRFGSGFVVLGARLRIDVNAIPAGMTTFRVHLYNASPTAIADNAAFDLPAGDRTKYLGYITVPAMADLGATLFALDDNLNFTGKLATGTNALYAVIQTVGAWTPAALTVFSLTLNVAGV